MTVMNTNRIAYCPLCNKLINRRNITKNKKIGNLVEKVQNLIDSIGKDTGFDITSHSKLPSSTCEAVLASPKFHQEKQETVSVQHEASPQKVSNSAAITSKEHWLKRYKKSYPGKREIKDSDVDLLSISQAEPLFRSYIAGDKALQAMKNEVDSLKVPPVEKVQEWLQRNGDEFDEEPVHSPLTVTPKAQQQKSDVIIIADVHKGLDVDTDLVSVSQQQFYIAPRKADMATLQGSSDGLCKHDNTKQASSEKRIFTSRVSNENNTKLGETVGEGQSVEGDPYEFISSQKVRPVLKKKMKTKEKSKVAVKKKVEDTEIRGPTFKKGNKKSTAEKDKLSCTSPVSEETFICPIEINDTFDNLVANTRKSEPEKMLKPDDSKVDNGDDNSDDVCLFRTPLEASVIYQKNDGSTTESMSDIDFSSGSDEEWGVANHVNQGPTKMSDRRTRSNSSGNLTAEKSIPKSTFKQKIRSKYNGIQSRRNEEVEAVRLSFKENNKHKLHTADSVKKTPLSPAKKLNLNTDIKSFNSDNMKQVPAVCKDTNNKSEDGFVTFLSTDKAHTGKENTVSPVTAKVGDDSKINLENKAMNMTVPSRSPGWSRISQSKKDFERFKKPVLKALNVSGGEVCIPKKHVVTSVNDMPKKTDITSEVMSPIPTIDDSESLVGIPVVAFNSPEAMNRVAMMSKILMNLESQIRPDTSIGNVAEVATEREMPQTVKDVTLKKFTSFGSSSCGEPTNSPTSCQRNELISAIMSTLEDDQLEHQCNERRGEQFVLGITKLGGDGAGAQDSHNKDNDNIMKNPTVSTEKENVLVVQETDSTMVYEDAIEGAEQNPVMDQGTISVREDSIQVSRSEEPITELEETVSSKELNQAEMNAGEVQNGNISSEHLTVLEGKGDYNPPAASRQDLQHHVLSKKCDKKNVVTSANVILNSAKPSEKFFFRTCSYKEPFTDLQPHLMSTEPMEITTEKFYQTEIQSSHNSSVGPVNTYPNKIHIPFIKCGRLKSLRKLTKFVLLGSLVPRRKNASAETFQEFSSADSLGLQFDVLRRPPLGVNYETGTQTSPRLLHPCHSSNTTDAKVQTTPRVNPQFVQFSTPTGKTNDAQGHGENFVPDSCDRVYTFPCAIPLPHHSVSWQTPADSNRYSKSEDSVISTICGISEPLHVDSDMKDHSTEDDADMNKTVMLSNHCGYSKPLGDYIHNEIPSSQFSTATTIKIQHMQTDNGGQSLRRSPELSPTSKTQSGLSISILQKSNSGKKIVDSIQDQYDTHTSQKAISNIQHGNTNNEERDAKSQQQNEVNESRTGSFTQQITEDIHSKAGTYKKNCGDTSVEKGNKKSRKVSRQLTYSPDVIPKLSDPCLDVSTEDERDIQKSQKKSYKRIRVATNSSDSMSTGSETEDLSDLEKRKVKKPCCTSLRKASEEGMDNEGLLSQEMVNDKNAETATEVINLLTPPEEANGSPTPNVDEMNIEEKWLGEDVPNSEELMARVMANIEADLAETRKRKMREHYDSDERRESPTLFTPPPVAADPEEMDSKMTCELVVSESEAEPEKRPLKESFLGNTTLGTDSESLCTQQRNKIQADIYNLEAEIKECKAELKKAVEKRSTDNTHPEIVCINSENESEDDFVETTPKKETSSNKTWDCKPKDCAKAGSKDIAYFQQTDQVNLTTPFSTGQNTEKRTVLHNPTSNCRSPSVANYTEIQCKQTGAPKYKTAPPQRDTESHTTPPTASKHFVLRIPQTDMPSTSPLMTAERVTTPGAVSKLSVPVNSSSKAKISTPADIPKQELQQPSPQTFRVQTPHTRLCFVCSGLHTGLIARVKALSKLLGAEFSNKFEPHTTHLIVKASDNMMADKTFKYLSAVVKKTWIVSISWVNACLQARKLVPEDEYEMLDSSGENGPHRSRTSPDLLFRNFEFCCIEPFTDLNRDQLEGILKECGAIVVNHPKKFSLKAGHYCMIIVQMDAKREEECKEWWDHYQVLPVGHEWVFECAGRYRIIPIWSFLMCAIDEDRVRALEYPEDALISDDDDDDDETVVESQV